MPYEWGQLLGATLGDGYTLIDVTETHAQRATFVAQRGDSTQFAVELAEPAISEHWAAVQRLTHPHLVRILETGTALLGGVPWRFRVLERAGDALSAVLAEHPLTAEEAEGVLAAVLPCLEYLHTQGWAHGAVRPAAVLAFGDQIKLSVETLIPAAGAEGVQGDLRGLGGTIQAMFAEPGEAQPELRRVPVPLREIAAACLTAGVGQPYCAARALARLRGAAAAPPVAAAAAAASGSLPGAAFTAAAPVRAREREHTPAPARQGLPRRGIAAAAIVGAAVLGGLYLSRSGPAETGVPKTGTAKERRLAEYAQVPKPQPVPPVEKPSPLERPHTPVAVPATVRATVPAGAAPQPRAVDDGATDWAVIAATYKSYSAAQKRATSLQAQYGGCECKVFPREGEGNNYYVVVGSGRSRTAAEALHDQAVAAGLPGDAYVTKLRTTP